MIALLRKNMVVVGVVAAALIALYYFYSAGGSSPLLSDSAPAESPVSQELLVTLGNLRTITLDDSVFHDPLFATLSDFGVSIPPATAGRRNPFAPVGQGGAPASAKTSTTTATTTPR